MSEQEQTIVHGDKELLEGLPLLCAVDGKQAAERHTTDSYGNTYHWYYLSAPDMILAAARLLKEKKARLCVISAYTQRHVEKQYPEICYHFELEGVVYNVTLAPDVTSPTVPSITSFFANADWHEREMMELYGITVANHPNPRRLFLDEELDAGIMQQVIPLSIMMNGASTTDLWERILAGKGDKA